MPHPTTDIPLLFAPPIILLFGALAVPLLTGRIKQAVMLALPLASLAVVLLLPDGRHWTLTVLQQQVVLGRVDALSRVFGIIFSLVAFIAVVFAIHLRDDTQHAAAFAYAGAALGVTFAGDLFSLYVFWEIMAVASTFLILARRTPAALNAGVRYVLVHLAGGLLLLAGIALYFRQHGSLAFDAIGLEGPAAGLIFAGIALNAAIPPLHPWLSDAYPEATPTGAVFLSAFTTKSAVYLMARTFPGTELLIWLGAAMTVIPIFYAVLENDIRRVLAYSLINQVGFMLCGIGIGTPLAINGTVAHAFCHILYKALLFMSAGAVLHRTGKSRCTDLGGLYKTMPLTAACCMVGAASISAFPLFSGFVSKSMIVSAAGHGHLVAVWLMLQFASAGVFHHAGIKVPYFTFFGHDAGLRPREAPVHMLAAMGIAAGLCLLLGVFPRPLYALLPHPVDYLPYTGAHVVGQLQLLMFGALAFCLLILSGVYPAEMRAVNLDTDWFYRTAAGAFVRLADRWLNGLNAWCDRVLAVVLPAALTAFAREAAVRLVLPLVRARDRVRGAPPGRETAVQARVRAALETATVPVGWSVAAIMVFLTLFLIRSR